MEDYTKIQVHRNKAIYVKLLDNSKLHVYMPNVVSTYMIRYSSQWIFEDVTVAKHSQLWHFVDENSFYKIIDNFANHELRKLINKVMLE